MEIKVSTRIEDGFGILEVHGEIDVYTHPRVCESVDDILTRGIKYLIFDLMDCRYIDSTGLGVLLGANKVIIGRSDSSIKVVSNIWEIKNKLNITGLINIFGCFLTIEAAKAAIMEEIASQTPA